MKQSDLGKSLDHTVPSITYALRAKTGVQAGGFHGRQADGQVREGVAQAATEYCPRLSTHL